MFLQRSKKPKSNRSVETNILALDKSIDDKKNPYIKKGFLFIKLDSTKSIPEDSYNFSDDEAKELNTMGHELEALKVAYEEKLKSLTGGNKSKKENQ